MNLLEIEVKFHLTDMAAMRDAVQALNPENRGRVFEYNVVFDDARSSLRRSRRLLRLRRDGQNRITVKAPALGADAGDFKVRREIEIRIDDFDAARSMLHALGYRRETVYEKWRETYVTNGGTHLCLDTLPFGDFLEIEGEAEAIRRCARRLGLSWEKRILKNYHALFDLVRRRERLDFSNITFDNFRGLSVDFTPCLPQARAGEPARPE